MFLTLGNISDGDFGEESLVGRFLLGLILNEYSLVNHNRGQALIQFARRCLSLDLSEAHIKKMTATIEFKPGRCDLPARLSLDGLLTIEPTWVWGIEAKYFDKLGTRQVETIQKYARLLEALAEKRRYRNSGLLVVAPEQKLRRLLKSSSKARRLLGDLIRQGRQRGRARIEVASWEVIFEILIATGPEELSQELRAYCEHRNQNEKYPDKLATSACVSDSAAWVLYLSGDRHPPPDLPLGRVARRRSTGGIDSQCRSVFAGRSLNLAQLLVTRIMTHGFRYKSPPKSDYLNFTPRTRVRLMLHSHSRGVVLVIGNAGDGPPRPRILEQFRIKDLPAYNRASVGDWLKGRGGGTSSPAVAFLIPPALINDSGHGGWREVDAVLQFARTR